MLLQLKRPNPQPMFPWWGQKDNRTLLIQFLERGLYLYKRNRQGVRAFAAGLAKDSGTTADFTVQAIFCLHTRITVDCRMHASSCMPMLVAVKLLHGSSTRVSCCSWPTGFYTASCQGPW